MIHYRIPQTPQAEPKPQDPATTAPCPNGGPPFAVKVMALRMILAWIQRRDAAAAAAAEKQEKDKEATNAA